MRQAQNKRVNKGLFVEFLNFLGQTKGLPSGLAERIRSLFRREVDYK
jgi:hypothetical protein